MISSQVAEEALTSVFIARPEVFDAVEFSGRSQKPIDLNNSDHQRGVLGCPVTRKGLLGEGIRRALHHEQGMRVIYLLQ